MASRNVDLLIRARDNASRAFKSVSDALVELDAIQGDVTRGADRVDSALADSAATAKKVGSTLGADVAKGVEQAEKIYRRIENTVAEATAQFGRQKAELAENRAAYQALGKQAEAAARAIKNAESRIGPQTEEQTNRLELMQRAYRDLTREIGKAGPALKKQESLFSENARELQGVTSAANAAQAALREVRGSGSRASDAVSLRGRTEAETAALEESLAATRAAEEALARETEERQAAMVEAAVESSKANARLENSIRDVVKAERDLAEAKSAKATGEAANAKARSDLEALTVRLENRRRADEVAAKAAAANKRAVDALNASYGRQRAAARVSAADQRKLASSFREAFTAASTYKTPLQNLYREIVRLGPATEGAANGVHRLAGRMTNGRQVFRAFYGDSRRALSLMQRFRGEILSLTASFVGFYGVFNVGRGILESFQRLEAAQNRLGAAFNQDYDRVNAELVRLNAEASRLGISFDVLSDNYSKFLISGQQAGLEVGQLRTIFRQVSEAGRVLKLSNEQIEGTFNAMIQIAGKGTLQMEELRQQLGDRLPGAVGLLASALGYGEGELAQFYKDVEDGAVGAEEALVALGEGLEEQYGGQLEDALDSVTAKVGNLQNILFQRQLTAANSGFIEGLAAALEALNEWLDSPEGIEFFEALGAAFGRLFEVLPHVLDNMGTLVTLIQSFVAIKIGQVVSGLGASFSALGKTTVGNLRVQVALNRAVAAYSPTAAAALRSTTLLGASLRGLRAVTATLAIGFKALWASIGGPIGIAAAALTFFAFDAVASTEDALDGLEDAMSDAEDTLGQVSQAFREAAGDAEVFKRKLGEINELDLKLDLKALKGGLEAATNGNRDAVSNVIKEVRALERAINDTVSDTQARAYFLRLTGMFDRGKISARELREGIDDLSQQFQEVADVTGLDDFLDWLDTLAEAEGDIERLEAQLAAVEETATEAQKALLGLSDGTDEATQKAKAARKQFKAFEEAMRELGELVPSINAKLEEFDAIREIEANFQAAMEAANQFTDAAQRAAAIGSAVDLRNQALRGFYDGQISDYSGTEGAQVASAFLRDQEGFRAAPYYDVNAYRVGFGSDTITLSDGTIQQVTEGMRVSVADAQRDLDRRIQTDFLPTARRQAGEGRFDSFNAQQQAALTSIAYNYGELPGRIVEAVRTGTDEEVAAAIRGLAQDNGGINSSRRNREAALFTSRHGDEAAVEAYLAEEEERQEAAAKRAEDQQAFRDGLKQEIADNEFLASIEGQRMIDQEVAKALRDAENDAKKVGLELTKEERAEVERVTRAKYATKQAEEDRNGQLEEAKKLEEQVTLLNERRRFLVDQIAQAEGNGDLVGVAKLSEELLNVEGHLDSAIEKAIAFWEAIGGDGSESAILALQRTQHELRAAESTAVTTGKQINDMFADRVTQAIDSFNQRVAAGERSIDVFRDEFLKMASDILVQIGQMIVRQAIFNALSRAFGGGANGQSGVGGLIAGGINGLFHNGGVVGAGSTRSARSVSPAVFANAVRYHSGGIAGLAPDEMGAILKKNEEILTENDPRHRFNGGASGGSDAGKPMTIINTFDADEVVERALSTPRGEDVLVNAVRAKRTEIKAALG